MPNGKPRDHPLTDILVHGLRVFSRRADRLIKEIVALGGQAEIERAFDLFAPPPKREFEQRLTVMRDRLKTERRWERARLTSRMAARLWGLHAEPIIHWVFVPWTIALPTLLPS